MSTEDKNRPRQFITKLGTVLEQYPIRFISILAFVVTLTIECLSRHSLWQGILFLFLHPVRFAANLMIVMVTLSIGLFFKKRVFFLACITGIWLGLGIANAVTLGYRVTPFGVIDIALAPSVFTVLNAYLERGQILLIIAGVVLVLVGLVFIYIKSPLYIPRYRSAALFFTVAVIMAAGVYSLTVFWHEDTRRETLSDIVDAYDQYGFVYCFCTGAFDRGISEPDIYSQSSIDQIVNSLVRGSEPELYPNIIMVQLESFFDVGYLSDLIYEENPIPIFTSLREQYSSGFLTVPSVGAGTANTEFEVLSGMSLDFFGMGEYPYKTILQEQTCETIAADLKLLGYTAHAIHNNTGIFYDRNTIYAQLGFDTFTSIEFMVNVEYNPIGWAKDYVLTEEIIKALDSTSGPSFVFTITVQGHGKYQRGVDSDEMKDLGIIWQDNEEDSEILAYYLSQLRETDEFIGELVKALESRDEPTVLVLYGDHLPHFSIGSDQLENGDVYETEYIIWDNFGLPTEKKDLSAYQLTAEVLKRLGIDGGILSMYHQQMSDRDNYTDRLGFLEYDMLYGERHCYGGENPYLASDLRMGVNPVVISGAVWENGVLTVYGENFTQWSRVTVDGKALDTIFVDDSTLTAELQNSPENNSILTVRQDTGMFVTLFESEDYVWSDHSSALK